MINFKEFLKKYHLEEDDRIISDEEANQMLDNISNYLKSESGVHKGDCTKENFTCIICYHQMLLDEYYKFIDFSISS